jgi:hypothetical protein
MNNSKDKILFTISKIANNHKVEIEIPKEPQNYFIAQLVFKKNKFLDIEKASKKDWEEAITAKNEILNLIPKCYISLRESNYSSVVLTVYPKKPISHEDMTNKLLEFFPQFLKTDFQYLSGTNTITVIPAVKINKKYPKNKLVGFIKNHTNPSIPTITITDNIFSTNISKKEIPNITKKLFINTLDKIFNLPLQC